MRPRVGDEGRPRQDNQLGVPKRQQRGPNLQSFLELTKAHDVVFVAEPPLHQHQGTWHCSRLPNVHPFTPIKEKTKLVAYCQKGSRARVRINRYGTATGVTIGGTSIVGTYLPGNATNAYLGEDLEWIAEALG